MKIRYTRRANAQLNEIHTYIADHDPKAARAVLDWIRRSIGLLVHFPYIYRRIGVEEIRVMPIRRYPYLVFYSVDQGAQEVLILRIRHSSQDPDKHLG